jgi:hypothetical protein
VFVRAAALTSLLRDYQLHHIMQVACFQGRDVQVYLGEEHMIRPVQPPEQVKDPPEPLGMRLDSGKVGIHSLNMTTLPTHFHQKGKKA